MRCVFCNTRLRQEDYQWVEELGEFRETGMHEDGSCVDYLGPDHLLDIRGYDHLDDFEETK